MNELSAFLENHAEPVLFVSILAEQLGVPVPAAPVLVAVGALAAEGGLNPVFALGIIIAACLPADLIWFYIGRHGGGRLVKLLCKFNLCDSSYGGRTERLFARFGMSAITAAKFVPGIGVMIPSLAGAFGIPFRKFLKFGVFGSFLYGSFFLSVGMVFSKEVQKALEQLSRFGLVAAAIGVGLVPLFIAYKYVQQRKARNATAGVCNASPLIERSPCC